jgi:hypothetical protein
MSDLAPLFLYEAVLSLYPADTDGEPLRESPVWWGTVANSVRLGLEYDELLMASSGDRYQTAHHVDERHSIEVERSWVLRRAAPADFVPARHQRYVLELVWSVQGVWYRRTYYGVTGRNVGWDSVRALHFGNRQSYRAENFAEADSGAEVTVPLAPEEQAIGFFREAPMVVGEYLLGQYRWGRPVQLETAQVVALAPQGVANALTLEVDGVLQSATLTIPAGPANTEVSATADLTGLVVRTGQVVRWKITSGPQPENAAWVAALSMQVQPM